MVISDNKPESCIGVFGGTFDPVHFGHLRCALEVKEIFGLRRVHMIPSATPPHRSQPKASAVMRLKMLEIALHNREDFVSDKREIDRSGPSYMVDTLKSMRQEFKNESLLLFIGNDAFLHLKSWHQWRSLFDYAHIVVLTRPGFVLPAMDDYFLAKLAHSRTALKNSPAGKLFFQSVTALDISASAIRAIISQSQDPSFLLPDAVIAFIKQHKLYETH